MARPFYDKDKENLLNELSDKKSDEIINYITKFLSSKNEFIQKYLDKKNLDKFDIVNKTLLSKQTVYNQFDYKLHPIPRLDTIKELIRAFDFNYEEANQFVICLIRDAVFFDKELYDHLKKKY